LYCVEACCFILLITVSTDFAPNMISAMMALRPQHVMNLYMNKYIIDIYLGNVSRLCCVGIALCVMNTFKTE